MDALSEVLRAARLSGGVFLRGEFSEPWCLASAVNASDCSRYLGPADHLVLYHYIAEGVLTIAFTDEAPQTFHPGQVAILPRNDPHTLGGRQPAGPVSALDVARIPKPGDLMVIDHGGGGEPTRIICGFLGGRALADDPLLSSLPKLLRFDCSTVRSGELVRTSLEFAAEEVAAGRAGSDAMLARLSELLFVEAVRNYVEALPDDADGWLGALKDRAVGQALAAIHANPEQPWTVDLLGREAGMSRSALAERFVRYVGHPPAEYLAQHRMRLAARELARGNAPLVEIAEAVGYGSEAAFSRAFKRAYGVAPSVWRRETSVQMPTAAN
ncbi:MAG: AraC family transcriptional regulator [Alphaproteobacteria bacterium]|nr:AraC family transcriptional regulator [Alphaproteobacteria bacterium]